MATRIGGLASGMDIDKIVQDLMRVERTKVDKVTQNKTKLEWTRDRYNEVNKIFADFVLNTRKAFGLTDTSSGTIVNNSVNSLKWIKSAVATDSAIADVSARSNAVNGSYHIKVHQLATNWSAASKEEISIGADKTNIKSQFDLSNSDIINFTITANAGMDNEQKVKVYVTNNEVSIRTTDPMGDSKITLDGRNLSNFSLREIADQINKSDIGVTAIYDGSIDRFFLQTDETGEQNTMQIIDESNNSFISKLKLQYDNNGNPADVAMNSQYSGKDAIIDFGMAKNIQKSSNQFVINNIDFNLKAVGEAAIKIDTDEDAVIGKVREFVHQYNGLIDKLDGILGESRHRNFPPLTEEQKKDMSEKEIDAWEEKARSGLLRNDGTINSTMQNLRIGLYERVEGTMGTFQHLLEIGIETESYTSGSMGGKLRIDETKFRNALRDDVDGVMDLLFKEPDSNITDDKEKRQNTGLVGRVYGDLVIGMKEIIRKAGPGKDAQLFRTVNSTILIDFVTNHSSISMLDESINDYSKRILELERRLADKEEGYWRKFTAMETALSKMYSQSDWLAQQLGS